MAKARKMPKTVYVFWIDGGTDDEYLVAAETQEGAIDGDGPTRIGTYQLVEENVVRIDRSVRVESV